MITATIFALFELVLNTVSSSLPVGPLLGLPSTGAVADAIGTYGGPFDKIIPLNEMLTFVNLWLGVWVPAALVYVTVFWVYMHIPVIGKG